MIISHSFKTIALAGFLFHITILNGSGSKITNYQPLKVSVEKNEKILRDFSLNPQEFSPYRKLKNYHDNEYIFSPNQLTPDGKHLVGYDKSSKPHIILALLSECLKKSNTIEKYYTISTHRKEKMIVIKVGKLAIKAFANKKVCSSNKNTKKPKLIFHPKNENIFAEINNQNEIFIHKKKAANYSYASKALHNYSYSSKCDICCFNEDGTKLAFVSYDKKLFLFDVDEEKLIFLNNTESTFDLDLNHVTTIMFDEKDKNVKIIIGGYEIYLDSEWGDDYKNKRLGNKTTSPDGWFDTVRCYPVGYELTLSENLEKIDSFTEIDSTKIYTTNNEAHFYAIAANKDDIKNTVRNLLPVIIKNTSKKEVILPYISNDNISIDHSEGSPATYEILDSYKMSQIPIRYIPQIQKFLCVYENKDGTYDIKIFADLSKPYPLITFKLLDTSFENDKLHFAFTNSQIIIVAIPIWRASDKIIATQPWRDKGKFLLFSIPFETIKEEYSPDQIDILEKINYIKHVDKINKKFEKKASNELKKLLAKIQSQEKALDTFDSPVKKTIEDIIKEIENHYEIPEKNRDLM
jgi:hypothetical protein